jgi:CheY-like chemotaxis protein
MSDDMFDFLDATLSDTEKFLELLAIVTGYSLVLDRSAKRLLAYHELLVDDVMGNTRAEDHLNKAGGIIAQLSGNAQKLSGALPMHADYERLALNPLLEGVVNRCNKLTAGSCSFKLRKCEALYLSGDAFQLQQVFYEAFYWLCQRPNNCTGLSVGAMELALNEKELSMMRLEGAGGVFSIVSIIPGNESEVNLGDYQPANELLGQPSEFGLPQLRFFYWLGVMQLHGGKLLVNQNGPCHGLMFLFPEIDNADAQIDGIKNGGQGETILLVDDEEMIWDVISDMLRTLGYDIILAENGREAVEIYQSNPGEIDLILLDMVMPEMNAREAFFLLKKIDPAVKVLLSSGYVSEEDAQDVLNAGAQGFLRKPYRMADLAKKIRSILDESTKA